MEEKILNTRKNGMAVLLLTLLGYVASIALFIYSITLLDADRMLLGLPLLILSIGYWIAGIFLFCGLKVLKPQEALVLTLFGDYIGTLKGQGFYWVNPFCTAVNPAAGTKLSQSGDVNSGETGMAVTTCKNNKPFEKTVVLMPQILHLGIGCRRNTPLEKIENFVLAEMEKHGFDMRCVKSIASVDLKKDETGLLAFAAKHNVPVKFYTAAELQQAKGDFTPSAFVKSIAGVDNVCERSAVLASGGCLKLRKTAYDGVTLAVAEEPLIIDF